MAWGITMISYFCRQPGGGADFRDGAMDGERLKDTVGPGRRFPFSPPQPENASATCNGKNTILLYSTW